MESTLSSMVIAEQHKEMERLNNVINDVTTANRDKDAIIQEFIDLANEMNPQDATSLPDDALRHIRSSWNQMSSQCEQMKASLKEKYVKLTAKLNTAETRLQTVEAELTNLRETRTKCCPKIIGRRRLPLRKKNKVNIAPEKDERAGKLEQIKDLKGDFEPKERLEDLANTEGSAPNDLDHMQGLQSTLTNVAVLEYDCHRLEEKNQRLRDLVETLVAHLRKTDYGPILDAKTPADVAVIATIGSNPCTELSINDVITFHATSIIDNDFNFKEIGRGAFGRVLLARHTTSSDTVAIKEPVIPPYFSPAKIEAERRSNLGQFTKEAVVSEFLSRSRHFPKLYGTLVLDDNMCIVQEFIGDKKTGKVFPLLNIMKSNPSPFLSPGSLLDIAVDVLEGIDFIHSNGLLHNDIKADNVLLELRNVRWQGFIIDQGLVSTIAFPPRVAINQSIMEDHKKKLSGNVYVAPEVVDDGTALSVASDIYSVGVVLVLIGRAARLQELIAIGESCSQKEPMLRPRSLKNVMLQVGALKERLALETIK